jgi:large conductance mechanosensitive channel
MSQEYQMIKEFKEFILRGNVLDLAVAIVVGTAFVAVVNAFANGVLLAFVAAIFGKPNFDDLTFTVGEGIIRYGTFLTALVNFLIVAVAMFLIIKTVNHLSALRKKEEEEADEPTEVELLTEIRDALVAGRDQR